MYRLRKPLPDPEKVEYRREQNNEAPWRLAGMTIIAASAVATLTLYCHLALMALAAFNG